MNAFSQGAAMKRLLRLCCLTMAALATTTAIATAQGRDLKVTMNDGRVTIIARNVSLREVLQEWARVGKTTIVNAEKLAGPPVSLQLVDSTERDALDILLRSAAGYLAVPRAASNPGTSVYDRIAILATSRAPAASMVAAAPPTPVMPPTPVQAEVLPTHGDYSAQPQEPPLPGEAPAEAPMPGEAAAQQQAAAPSAGSPFGGLAPHLEGAQPRGFDLNKMLGKTSSGAPSPATATTPGATVPGPYRFPSGPTRPGGGG
jgi:hypothetical protein